MLLSTILLTHLLALFFRQNFDVPRTFTSLIGKFVGSFVTYLLSIRYNCTKVQFYLIKKHPKINRALYLLDVCTKAFTWEKTKL